jgi:hypothetical protein
MGGKRIVGLGALALVVVMTATACHPAWNTGPRGNHNPPSIDDGGFVSSAWMTARQDDYLQYATTTLSPGSVTNVINHAERAQRDPGFSFDAAAVTPETFAPSFDKIDNFVDTADFDLLYLMNLWFGSRDLLTPELRAAIEQRMVAFKYWYTDPQPAGVVDNRYYWTENHAMLFHVEEYLAGQAFPQTVFGSDGKTGVEHRARAAAFIDTWLAEKARFGFTEWHSDVYYQKTANAILTFIEFADDPARVERASMVLDELLFDVALHTQKGYSGATRGRSYMKDKSVAEDQDVFGLTKLLFDDTTLPYQSNGDAGATLFARAKRYRMPAVLLRVAKSTATTVDRERMGVPIDPHAPIVPNPPAPYGYTFDDPANVPFWWERGALTAWQVVPTTIAELDRYNLWESSFFSPFKPLADIAAGDPAIARTLAQALASQIAFGLLSEVNTITFRSPEVMLSTAQSWRPGDHSEQAHISQATLDEHAIVFTTHPKNEPESGTMWRDDDGYWTGQGSLPRAAQHGAVSMSLYAPNFAPTGPPLDTFSYLQYTHAYFPQERFDEVVQAGGWTFGRRGDGYVALWSWRPTRWRTYDDPGIFTHGLTQSFDLVADGGPDNTWITQVGDASTFGSFAAFRAAVTGRPVQVAVRPVAATGLPGGFDVSWDSPTEGPLTFGSAAPLTVKGAVVPIDAYPRYDNPWSRTPFDAQLVKIADAESGVILDFASGNRTLIPPRRDDHHDHGHHHGHHHDRDRDHDRHDWRRKHHHNHYGRDHDNHWDGRRDRCW